MKPFILFFGLCCSGLIAQTQNATFSVYPTTFLETETITLTVSNINPAQWGIDDLYLWAWYFKNGTQEGDAPNNGTWDNSNELQKMTHNGDGSYSISFIPSVFFNDTNISQMGLLVKAKDGTGDKKTQDYLHYVGKVQISINTPSFSTVVVSSGGSLNISANMSTAGSTQVGDFNVFYNNTLITSGQGYPNYNYTLTNITQSGTLKIVGTPFGQSDSGDSSLEVIVAPSINVQSMPQALQDGIHYDPDDSSKATLILNAPEKDFVYVAGSFNNYNPTATYLMNKDPDSSYFWLELTNLIPQETYHYQYWVYDSDPVSDSPYVIKTADPYSTLVLSPFDDYYISDNSYPNIPAYPEGQDREVTLLQTAQAAYQWQIQNFQKPDQENLVIYEVLVRDFDENRTFQDLINRVNYFKELGINAIQLMPVMEFEGNESWGYNTAFHLALDKFYGTPDKLKELVDVFHQNGIAVILDLAINHAFGRAPGVRMWMTDSDNDGWGEPSSENPYFNSTPKHSYNVGSDFNHQQELTQTYTKRVIKHWIEEFKIDGFRWDLTKGFTQNCSSTDTGCTNSYQADRVAILKEYADYSWSLDADHYVIFEHLGEDIEEKEWADYRLDENKGIMLWGKMTDPYSQLAMGFGTNASISRMKSESRGFNGKRLIGYYESHDEERIMFKTINYGNSSQSSHNVSDLNIGLSRMSALGAVSLLIPGPKMIWHFGELGMENSIFTCSDGTYDNDGCKLDTKPQPQWVNNWLNQALRSQIYNDWNKIIELKKNNTVFRANSTISPYNNNNLLQRIYIWDDELLINELKNVIILANFDVVQQAVLADFPHTGTWYNLMNDGTINVSSTTQTITLDPGEYIIYGNQEASLSTKDNSLGNHIQLVENPAKEHILIDVGISSEYSLAWKLYNVSGVELKKGIHQKEKVLRINSPESSGLYFIVLHNPKSHQYTLVRVIIP